MSATTPAFTNQKAPTLPPEIAELAQGGWRLFPVKARDKVPLVNAWPVVANKNIAQLEAWAARFPGCNWGIATGAGSGVVVVDVDGKEGRDSQAALEREGHTFPTTLTVLTGREDGGVHLYCRLPPGIEVRNNNSGKLGPHIDVRGEGGYVVIPPSTHVTGRQYQFVDPNTPIATLPSWVIDRLRQPASQASATPDAAAPKIIKGNRHNMLISFAGTMHKRSMSQEAIAAALLAENTAKCDPPLPEAKVRKIAAEIVRRYPPGTPDGAGRSEKRSSQSPAQFELRADGVFHNLGEDCDGNPKPPLWLCGHLEILAKTRDGNNAAWGRLLRWRDDDQVPHEWAMPSELLQSDGVAVRSELARLGLAIAPGRAAHDLLLTYLQMWPVGQRARCVDRLGWHGPVYVVPSETIGEEGEHIVFQNAHALEPAFSTAGTTEEWRDHVAAIAQGNSRMVLAISVAFAGPLLEPAGEDSGGFHLRGASSTGKSTALRLAASIWGNPSHYCRLWRATTNGLEGIAALHNDGILILDELGQVNAREAGEAAYMLANQKGKTRAARDGTARPSAQWRLLFLSAGEESLAALMAQVGRKPTTGQEIRLADFDVDAGAGMGALERLNGFASSTALAAALKNASGSYYGSVGADWLRWLVAERSKLATFISDGVRQFVEEHAATDTSGQVERVARRFGLVGVAGELATHAGLTGWQQGEAEQAAGKCFNAWRDSFGGSIGNREERALLGQVKGFFEQFGASRFESLNSTFEQRIPIRAGFYRQSAEGQREYLVLPEVFKNEVCKGFHSQAAVTALRTHGWLIPGPDRNQQKFRPPDDPEKSAWAYVISGGMWEYEG